MSLSVREIPQTSRHQLLSMRLLIPAIAEVNETVIDTQKSQILTRKPSKYKVDAIRPQLLKRIEAHLKIESGLAKTEYAQLQVYRDIFDMFIYGTIILFNIIQF